MLRKAIAAYIHWLEARARSHASYASVLRAVAHRLQHILADNPAPTMHTEYGQKGEDGKVYPIDVIDPDLKVSGTQLYKRQVTEWEEIR